jgi:16S rRNA (cytosine967-C5)-methyltransferase
MPVSPSRLAAFSILLRVERDRAYASDLLHASDLNSLAVADRALATEIVMGTLRWQSKLDSQLAAVSSQKLAKLDVEVLVALRMAVYQLRHLERVPAHAVVHESVELVKRARKASAVPFANAVLRKFTGSAAVEFTGSDDPDDLALDYAHPQWLVERWIEHFGAARAKAILADDQKTPDTAIRVANDASVTELEAELKHEGIALAPGQLLSSARRVVSGDVARTRAFKEGRVAIQDEASQLVALLVGSGLAAGTRILDCCAAPGSKTAVIAERNPQATIVATELHPHRARQLAERMRRFSNVTVRQAAAAVPTASETFERILVDVPCSGTGTLARNPEIKWKLTPGDLADIRARQLALFNAALAQLAPAGRLVYSTCSLEPEENESVVEEALAANPQISILPAAETLRALPELAWPDPASLVNGPYLRTVPGVHPCEGFFAAVLSRK